MAHLYIYIYDIFMYIYICVCVCVCVSIHWGANIPLRWQAGKLGALGHSVPSLSCGKGSVESNRQKTASCEVGKVHQIFQI